MTYIAFKHTHKPQDLISAISLLLLVKEDKFEWENVVLSHIPTKVSKLSTFELIGNLIACEEFKRKKKEFTIGYTIIKIDKKITTDKFFTKNLKASYIGCLPAKTTKKELVEKLNAYKSVSTLRKLKHFFQTPMLFVIKHNLPELDMTDKEIEALIKLDMKQERNVQAVIDKKIDDAFSKASNEPLLIRDF
ncbi:hypothetical protein A4F89_10385 [Polynucleobacter asymbioticus]|uniref:hypothetical protein n=1 Tax=Polynucleobacter asymbioticus TaxID=576611 RepID=UPI0008FB8014|nr:hypothetical protein [Polynucleobacter asymbioticus]APB99713.1 hypothetical protein A4F89_10385 [Polynucleobacter asymbioticus]